MNIDNKESVYCLSYYQNEYQTVLLIQFYIYICI